MRYALPGNLAATVARAGDDRWTTWLAGLEPRLDRIIAAWEVEVGPPFEPGGQTAWVAPARTRDGTDCVLKVGYRHTESEHEAEGLRTWGGEGAVRLLAVDRTDDTCSLLLERAVPGDELGRSLPEEQQDEVLSGLLRRLWLAPTATDPFRPLVLMCDEWADQHLARPNAALDPGIARLGLAMFRELPREATAQAVLVTDLHAGNILAAEREPWLVIDPKPYVGDPCYDPVQHMLNCTERLTADPVALSDRMADLCGVDAERVRRWMFARFVVESAWWDGLGELAMRLAP